MAAFVLAGALALALAAPAGAFVYWSNLDNAIARANLDGSATEPRFLSTSAEPGGIAVDGSHVYWNSSTPNGYKIGRAGLDGSGVQLPFIDQESRRGIVVDGQHIYWSTPGSIARANLDGSDIQPQFIAGTNQECGIAVDAGHIYWADTSTQIGRANLDGTGVNHSFITGAQGVCDVDVNAAHVFWTNTQLASIGRANLDGSGVDQSFIPGGTGLCGVAVNETHVYWSRNQVAIGRANLDGGGVNQDFVPGRVGCGIAVDALTTANLTVTPSALQIVFGQDITFDAAVSGAGAVPTGSVQFFVNDAPDGAPAPLDATGHAFYSPTFLLGVGDRISAVYSGDAVYGPVRKDASPIVQPAPTSTQMSVEPSTVVTGGQVAVTATVTNTMTGITPFGSVQFVIDGELFGDPFELDESGQIAFGLIAGVPPADYLVTAYYADDLPPFPYFLPSSASQVVRVTAPPGSAPPPAGPSGGVQPAQPTPTVVRKRDLTALGAVLVKRLNARGFAALTAPLSFTAPGPGTLTQRVFAQGARPNTSAARAKETLIATGRREYPTAGTGTLRSRLTAAGRRTTKHAERVKLRIVTRFAPTTGSAVSSSQRATVKRRGRRPNAAVTASGWTLIAQR